MIASALPDGVWKIFLTWLAPAATATVSAIWIWARRQLIEYVDRMEDEREFNSAREAIHSALGNQNLSKEERENFQRRLVELEQMIVELRMTRVSERVNR